MTAGATLVRLIDALPEELRERVFTHASWAGDRRHSYERLEFLGDSVLGLTIAQEIFERFPDYEEGRLAKIRAHVVSRRSCAEVGARLGLGNHLASRGGSLPSEEIARLSENRNVLAAVVEAVLGAVYLIHGFETARPAVIDAFGPQIDYALNEYVDYKTELQEELGPARPSSAVRGRGDRGPTTRPALHVRSARRRAGARRWSGRLQEGRRADGGTGGARAP